MASSNKNRDQRRREKKRQRRATRKAAAPKRLPAEPSPQAVMTTPTVTRPPPPDVWDLDGHSVEGELNLDPYGRLATVRAGKLHVATPEEQRALATNLRIGGSFADDFDYPASEDSAYVLSPPAQTETGAEMRIGVLAPSDTEVDGFVWHPTYTARLRWSVDAFDQVGEWALEVVQDVLPGSPYATCWMGEDGTRDDWEGGFDRTSDIASSLAADHREDLLRLARQSTPQG